jgi:thiamine-phosphate pyrophosphorylase
VLADPDLGRKAAALAALGPALALHLRDHAATTSALATQGRRFVALATPPEAAVFVNGRPDLARALGAHGVQLGGGDLAPADARRVLGAGWVGRSVHSEAEARTAVDEGADFLLVGAIYPTDSHPGRPAAGLELITRAAALGRPVIAIGGITPERVAACRAAGAWGVAAIRALWEAQDPYAAGRAMLDACEVA